MKPRTRSKSSFAASGKVSYPPNYPDPGPYPYQRTDWLCHDFIEKSKETGGVLTPPSDLYLRKTEFKPPLFNYRLSSLVDGVRYFEGSGIPCYPGDTAVPSNPPLGWSYLEGTDNELVAKLLADTNPFAYEVSVPVMVAELVEAGSLLKLAANNFASLVGSAYLNKVFGWDATIRDIKTLASITGAIESKIKEFNDLVEKGGSRRRKFLEKGAQRGSEITQPILGLTGMGTWYGKSQAHYTTKVWGSVRWVPNRTSTIDFSKLATFNQACKTVLDLRVPDTSTIWEAIPFSWLVDYFVNVGDVLQAIEDTDKVLPLDICLMRRRRVVVQTKGITYPEDDWPWKRTQSFSDGEVIHDLKIRNVVAPPEDLGDLLSFGIMSKGQATNLIALLLSLTRFKR